MPVQSIPAGAAPARQRGMRVGGVLLFLVVMLPVAAWARPLMRHDLSVVVQPAKHWLRVTDTVTVPAITGKRWHFRLHAGWRPVSPTPGVRLVRRHVEPRAAATHPPLEHYAVTLPAGTRTFVVHYEGAIHHPWPQQRSGYAHGGRDAPGMIAADGIFLSAATSWYPQFDNGLLTFTLDVQLPPAWDAVSQGERTRHERQDGWTRVRWESPEAQEQIYLVGGTFTEYSRAAGSIQTMVFLRTPDAQLAQKYLQATARYLALYSARIGPYPYKKFALLENVWESGYGMPSFTPLGSKVIRLPFILHSSYPHEILHSWWGNSVFVNAAGGNWSEGLTAYLADHLMQEHRGTAVTYRRTTLQNYTDYVAAHRDFPLTAFRGRHDAVTQAIGYGKALMFFHMLRQQMGDEVFTQALRTFYRDHRFQQATFDDLHRAFASAAGTDLREDFRQWLTRSGAPELRLGAVAVRSEGPDYVLTAVIEQVQPGLAYRLRLPIAVSLDGREQAYQTTVMMPGKRLDLTLRLPARPRRLTVDPRFDLFRRLHRGEIPPALTQMFGAENVLMLLPAAAAAQVRRGYQQLAQAWQKAFPAQIEVRWDDDVTALPTDRAVWLCGWENRWRSQLRAAVSDYPVVIADSSVRFGDTTLTRTTHAVVLTARHPQNPQLTFAWMATENPAALPGLGRKLPHYGTYSYLGFTGDEPVNVVKGQWPVLHSPMSRVLQ